jgi:hypothetical protein
MAATSLMPPPPAGPVPARISRRTSAGRMTASRCAMKPPSENPSRSTCFKPLASRNAAASRAISATLSGVTPPERPTPRLSKMMTRRVAAIPSRSAGSQARRDALSAAINAALPGLRAFCAEEGQELYDAPWEHVQFLCIGGVAFHVSCRRSFGYLYIAATWTEALNQRAAA